jgi:hypothetical protein
MLATLTLATTVGLTVPAVGLHDYATPVAPAPTASPTPGRSVGTKTAPTAGHTVAGSGRRTIRFRSHMKTSHNLEGSATWFATGRSGAFAAAGPLLRKAIGKGWRGSQVLVCHAKRCLIVTLNDWCLCSHGRRLVDLSDEAFRYLAPLSRGVISVAVGW